jgi:hypothetical protein
VLDQLFAISNQTDEYETYPDLRWKIAMMICPSCLALDLKEKRNDDSDDEDNDE